MQAVKAITFERLFLRGLRQDQLLNCYFIIKSILDKRNKFLNVSGHCGPNTSNLRLFAKNREKRENFFEKIIIT